MAKVVSATVAVTSDYRFRGISQSDNEAAIQGSIDFAQDWFFAGVWASNLDFSGFGDPDTSVEVDLYAGATAALSDSVSGTIKAVYYAYPDGEDAKIFGMHGIYEADGYPYESMWLNNLNMTIYDRVFFAIYPSSVPLGYSICFILVHYLAFGIDIIESRDQVHEACLP